MAEAAQLEEEPRTSAEIEADPYAVAGVEPPGSLTSADASKLLTRQETVMKDLEAQRALTSLNASKRAAIVAESEKSQVPLRDEAVSAMRAREAAGEAVAAQPLPSLPQPPKIQDYLDRDTASMMAGIASLIAGFNSNGRVRGIRANQSLAAGLKGFQEGSLLRAKLGLEDWKNQVEQQMMEFKMIRQRNLDILQAKGMTIEDKLKEIELSNAPYKNEMMQATIEKEGIDGVVKIDQDMAKIIDSMERTLAKANPALTKISDKILLAQRAQGLKTGNPNIDALSVDTAQQMSNVYTGAGGPGGAPGTAKQTGEAILEGVAPGDAAIVRGLVNYKIPLPSGFALRSPKWVRLLELAQQYDPSFDAKLYNLRMQTQIAYKVKGKPADNIRSLNTAIGHLQSLKSAGEDLNNLSIRQLNSWINYGLTEIAGDPRVKSFNVAANAVAGELSNVFKGTSGTDTDIKSWRKELSSSDSPEQIDKGIDKAIELLGSRISVLTQQYEAAMGKEKDFQILHPKSRQILKSIGANPDQLDPVSKGESSLPSGGQIISGKIVVRNKETGQTGLLSEKFFDPAKYEKVQGPVKAGETSATEY